MRRIRKDEIELIMRNKKLLFKFTRFMREQNAISMKDYIVN